jgi:hypothetical protein
MLRGKWYTKQSKYIQKNLKQIIPKIIINFRIPPNPHINQQHASSYRTITPQLLTDKLIKEKETHPRNKNNKQKKRQPFLVAF